MTVPGIQLPARRDESHKGDYGRVQIIGGSPGMAGAVALAARAALRSGAGLVQVVCPAEIRGTVTAIEPCATTAAPGESDVVAFAPTVRALGPGCRDTISEQRLQEVLSDTAVPVVVDADGLNLLARIKRWWSVTLAHVLLTPHPGEMRRLLERTEIDAGLPRQDLAQELSQLCRAVVVLKGHHTVVAQDQHIYVNQTGNPGMASGGSGDVLTGVMAALLGQGLSPYDAACLGTHLHGLAGDLAARQLGQISLTATDLIDFLPQAFREHQSSRKP